MTAQAAEQDRPGVLTRRWAWFDGQPDFNPDHAPALVLNSDGGPRDQGDPRKSAKTPAAWRTVAASHGAGRSAGPPRPPDDQAILDALRTA